MSFGLASFVELLLRAFASLRKTAFFEIVVVAVVVYDSDLV